MAGGLLGAGIVDLLGITQTQSALAATDITVPDKSRVLSLTAVKDNPELVAAAYRAKQQGKALA
jgi:hypothetical protein